MWKFYIDSGGGEAMAEVTDTEAVKFVREEIRPIAERLSVMRAEIESMMSKWFGGISSTIGSSANDTVVEDREAEGVPDLTGEDVTGVMAILDSLNTTLNAAGVADRIENPCVRPFRNRVR